MARPRPPRPRPEPDPYDDVPIEQLREELRRSLDVCAELFRTRWKERYPELPE